LKGHKFQGDLPSSLKAVVPVVDDECSGHLLMSRTNGKVNQVKELALKNRRLAIREIHNVLGISLGSV
jgi:hypothetical protein